MPNARYTPGPWTFRRCTIGSPDNAKNPIVSAPGRYIARLFADCATFVGMTSQAPTLEEAEANAKLIAAAPELLEACRVALKAVRYFGRGGDICGDEGNVTKILENAIAKAEANA